MPRRSSLWRLGQLLVSVCALAVLALAVDVEEVGPALARSSLPLLLVLLLGYFASVGLRVLRLHLVLNKEAKLITLWRVTVLIFAGEAVSFLVPGVGGELARAYYGVRSFGMGGGVVSGVLADRLSALSTLLLMAAVPMARGSAPLGGVACALCALLLALPVFWPRVVPWGPLSRLVAWGLRRPTSSAELADACRLRGVRAAAVFGLAAAGWAMTAVLYALAARAVGLAAPLSEILLAVPVVTLVRILPLSLGGLGVQEAALVVVLSGGGATAEAAAMAVLLRLFMSLPGGVLGVAALAYLARIGPAATAPPPEEARPDGDD